MENNKFIVKKNNRYLGIDQYSQGVYFTDNKKNAIIFENRRFAENIAYDYRGKVENMNK